MPLGTRTNDVNTPAVANRDAREAKMKAEMQAREVNRSTSANENAPTIAALPFFKVAADVPAADISDAPPPPPPIMLPQTPDRSNPTRPSFLRSPSAKSPTGMLRAGGGFGDRSALIADYAASESLQQMPTLTKQVSLEEMAKTCASPSPYGLHAAHGFPATTPGGAGDQRLFDRAGTSTYKPRELSADDKENALPAYQEVRVERFGWRRRSFITRQDSPLLAR